MEGRWARLVLSAHSAGRLDPATLINRHGASVLRERIILEQEERIILRDVVDKKLTMADRMEPVTVQYLSDKYGHSAMPWVFSKPTLGEETSTNIEDIVKDPDKAREYYDTMIAGYNASLEDEDETVD